MYVQKIAVPSGRLFTKRVLERVCRQSAHKFGMVSNEDFTIPPIALLVSMVAMFRGSWHSSFASACPYPPNPIFYDA